MKKLLLLFLLFLTPAHAIELDPPGAGKYLRWSANGQKIEAVNGTVSNTFEASLPNYTVPTLPATADIGELAYVTDEADDPYNARGVYVFNGSQWFKTENNLINARIFAGVNGKCATDQVTGLTNWINAVKKIQAQNLNFAGYLPAGCYKYSAALPDISANGMTIIGEGRRSVLFNASAAAALTVTGQNVRLEGLTIEGTAGSSHGIHLKQSHYFTGIDVVVNSAGTGTGKDGWRVEGVITLTTIDARGTCNVPGCILYSTDITANGGRGTPDRAVNFIDGASFSNNDHSWISFKNNGGHTGHGVVYGGMTTGVNFIGGVFEAPPVGFNAILISGSNVKNNTFIAPYISCSTGLGLEINDAMATTLMGGQSNCATTLKGDARANVFYNFETTAAVNILVDGGDTPRMNSFFGGRITGTVTDNGTNTTFLATTDNTSTPRANKLAGGLVTETGTWSADLAGGTRVAGTVYQNTSGKARRVSIKVVGATAGKLDATLNVDSANPPVPAVALVANRTNAAAAEAHTDTLFSIIPNNWYYKLVVGVGTLNTWQEMDE